MPCLRRSQKVIWLHSQLLPQLEKELTDPVDKFLRTLPRLRRALLDLLAVLIQPTQKTDGLTPTPRKTSQSIGQHLFIGVSQVWLGVGVIDRGR